MAWKDSLVRGAAAVWKGAVIATPYVKKTAQFTYECFLSMGYHNARQRIASNSLTDEERVKAEQFIEYYEAREREKREREEERQQ